MRDLVVVVARTALHRYMVITIMTVRLKIRRVRKPSSWIGWRMYGCLLLRRSITYNSAQIITQAHAEPTHVESLRAIVSLFKKYLHRIQTALSVTSEISNHVELATIVPDPALRELLVDIKTLLERFASYHSLDTCASQISQTISVILAESSSSSTDVGSMNVGILKHFEDWALGLNMPFQ